MAGTAIYAAADMLMALAGDAMYITLRIERRDGFGARACGSAPFLAHMPAMPAWPHAPVVPRHAP